MTLTWLDTDAFKARVPTTSASDAAIAGALAAAQESIENALGTSVDGTTTERLRGGIGIVFLGHRAASVTTVLELVHQTRTELDPADWELDESGTVIRRLNTGPNASHHWRGQVVVAYTPYLGEATILQVQTELTQFILTVLPSMLKQEKIGEWAETFYPPDQIDAQRDQIMEQLYPASLVYFRGSGHAHISAASS